MPCKHLHNLSYKISKCWATNYDIKVLRSPQKVRTWCLNCSPFPKFYSDCPFHLLHFFSQPNCKRHPIVCQEGKGKR